MAVYVRRPRRWSSYLLRAVLVAVVLFLVITNSHVLSLTTAKGATGAVSTPHRVMLDTLPTPTYSVNDDHRYVSTSDLAPKASAERATRHALIDPLSSSLTDPTMRTTPRPLPSSAADSTASPEKLPVYRRPTDPVLSISTSGVSAPATNLSLNMMLNLPAAVMPAVVPVFTDDVRDLAAAKFVAELPRDALPGPLCNVLMHHGNSTEGAVLAFEAWADESTIIMTTRKHVAAAVNALRPGRGIRGIVIDTTASEKWRGEAVASHVRSEAKMTELGITPLDLANRDDVLLPTALWLSKAVQGSFISLVRCHWFFFAHTTTFARPNAVYEELRRTAQAHSDAHISGAFPFAWAQHPLNSLSLTKKAELPVFASTSGVVLTRGLLERIIPTDCLGLLNSDPVLLADHDVALSYCAHWRLQTKDHRLTSVLQPAQASEQTAFEASLVSALVVPPSLEGTDCLDCVAIIANVPKALMGRIGTRHRNSRIQRQLFQCPQGLDDCVFNVTRKAPKRRSAAFGAIPIPSNGALSKRL